MKRAALFHEFVPRILLFCPGVVLLASSLGAAVPSTWELRGIGGGGGFFSPAISPQDSKLMFMQADQSEAYRTTNGGLTWETIHFQQLQATFLGQVEFTSVREVLYAVDMSIAANETQTNRPAISRDAGVTWAPCAAWSTASFGIAGRVYANPHRTNHFLTVSGSGRVYVSHDSGASFQQAVTGLGNNNRPAGAFFDPALNASGSNNVFIAFTNGVYLSTNSGNSFALQSFTGIPAGENVASFAAAKDPASGQVRFYAVTTASAINLLSQPDPIYFGSRGVYRLDWSAAGPNVWQSVTNGISANLPASVFDQPGFVAMSRSNIDVVYLSAYRTNAGAALTYPDEIAVYKVTSTNDPWTNTFLIRTYGTPPGTNVNLANAWGGVNNVSGAGGSIESLGFFLVHGITVNAADPQHVLIATDGHPMMTTNGGAVWRQVYVDPANENPPGAPIPHGKAYRGNGLDIVVNYFTCFPNPTNVLIACNDNGVITSGDSGQTWAFRQNRSTLPNSDVYQIISHPVTGTLYANNPFTQTPYQFKAVGDADIDPAASRNSSVRFQAVGQTNWSLLKAFPGAPMWMTIDPFDTERMYVSVAHSVNGGIYFTTNLAAGTNAIWSLLTTNRPASMGVHPFNVRVLDANRLLASYSARSNSTSGGHLAEAGVFLSTNRGASWTDVSDPGMKFYTHDVVVDTHDPSGNTWVACVSRTPNTNAAGVYLTTNAGANWARIFTNGSIVSATINPRPTHSNEIYICTHFLGLWRSGDFRSGTPTFQQVTTFPFRFPQRVFFNPFQPREIWVNTDGNGTRVGTVTPLEDWRYANFDTNETNAAIAGDAADPDADGAPNLLEYLLGTVPNDPSGTPAAMVGSVNLAGSNFLTLTFTLDTTSAGATATVLVSRDLTNWFSGSSYAASNSVPVTTFTTEVSRSGGNPQTIVVRDNVPMQSATSRFLKLRVSSP